jgi:hypothetical protein
MPSERDAYDALAQLVDARHSPPRATDAALSTGWRYSAWVVRADPRRICRASGLSDALTTRGENHFSHADVRDGRSRDRETCES